MVDKLKAKLSGHRRTRLTLEMREGNLEGQLFFRRQGFLAGRVLRGYYEDSGEDCYLMSYNLPLESGGQGGEGEEEAGVNRIGGEAWNSIG